MRLRHFILAALALASCGPQGLDQRFGEQDQPAIIRSYPLKFSGSVNVQSLGLPAPTFECGFDQDQSGATITCESGHVLTKAGGATRVSDGTWPAGPSGTQGYATRLDGSGDYWTCAEAICPFEPAGDFSVTCIITPRAGWAQNDVIMSKYAAGAAQWSVYGGGTGGVNATVLVSDDGSSGDGHQSTYAKASSIAVNRTSTITFVYDYAADGTSTGSIYVDRLTAGTGSSLNGPVWSGGSSAVGFGSHSNGVSDATIDIHHCWYWDGTVVTLAQHRAIDAWWRGWYDNAMANPITVAASNSPSVMVAPADSGTQPFIEDMPPNSTQIGQRATSVPCLYGSDGMTNLFGDESTFEAAVPPAGWSETITSTGDAALSAWGTSAHGMYSAQGTNADADDEVSITSPCLVVTDGGDYSISWFDKLVSGTGALEFTIYEDDSADCATPTGHTTIGVVPILNTWNERETPYTMQAGTIRAQVVITWPAAAAQVSVVDAIQLIESDTPSYTYCATDAACSDLITGAPNPGAGTSRFEFTANLSTPFGVLDLDNASVNWYLVCYPSASVDDAWSVQLDPSAGYDALRCTTHLDGPNYIYDFGGEWLANTVYRFKCSYCSECRAKGDIRFGVAGSGYVPGTNYAAINDGAIRDSPGSGPVYFFSQSTNGIHGCVSDYTYGLRLTQ